MPETLSAEAEHAGGEVTERLVGDRMLELAADLAAAVSNADSFEQALEVVLRGLCEEAGWELGQVWMESPDRSCLECGKGWHGSSERFETFRRLSEAFVFTKGVELPGKVWARGEAIWIGDLASSAELSRGRFAEPAGLGHVLGVPVRVGEETVAVIELFGAGAREADDGQVALASAVASQLGSLVGRRRAEVALELSEQHLGAVAETAADAIVSAGSAGDVTFFNEAAERLFGYRTREIVGRPITQILPGLVERIGDGSIERLAAEPPGMTFELAGKRKDGTDVPLEVAFSSWSSRGETFLTGVLRDTSDRRRAEEALREAEERFRGAFEHAPAGMALVSIESDRAGCVLRVNKAFRGLTGFTDSSVIGAELASIVDLSEDDRSDRRYVPWMLAGELSTFEIETRLRHVDGGTLDVVLSASLVRDGQDRPLYLIAQVHDVSARREAERGLHESRERMQAIIDNTTAIVYLKDLDGRYLLVNSQFEAIFGVDRYAAVGRTDHELFELDLAGLLRANDLRVMRELVPLEVEEVVPHGDHPHTYLSTKFPLLDASRVPYAVCGISTDITERKRAEEALRASESHFREIVNTTHEAFISMDSDGTITAWNPEAETTFGWSESEAVGRSLADTIVPERYRDQHQSGLDRFRRTGRGKLLNQRIEIEARHRDGHEFPVELTITSVKVGGGYSFNAFLHDISERKQAEQTLRRLADIIESSRDAIVATTTDGEITSWNPGAEQLYGYAPNETIGRDLVQLVGPGPAKDVEAVRRAIAGRRLEDYETEQLRKDGSLVPVSISVSPMRDSTGALIGASVITRDRTERKRAEEALREVQEAFRSAFDEAPIGMALFDIDPRADGRLLEVNRSLCEITGYSNRELLGTSLHAITHPFDQEHELALAEDLLSGEIPHYQVEKRYLRGNGEVVWVLHNASTVHDSTGRLLYGIAQVQNITERKRAEEGLAKVAAELERRAAELERSNADLQEFAYVASHDLSEPLRMVSSYVQLLARRYEGKLDSDADEFIEYAVDGVNRMQRLIEDLLAYSRVGTSEYELEPVDCRALLEDTLGGMRATITDSGAIVTGDDLPTVRGDESQLRQLFQNLISNAIKFVEEGPPRIHVSAVRDGRAWRFAVADNGIGIDPQHAERIFAVFKRLHGRDAYAGSGIGLSICKRIVERHQGRIWVEPNEGGGSRFCFTIPDGESGEAVQDGFRDDTRGQMSDSSGAGQSRQINIGEGEGKARRQT